MQPPTFTPHPRPGRGRTLGGLTLAPLLATWLAVGLGGCSEPKPWVEVISPTGPQGRAEPADAGAMDAAGIKRARLKAGAASAVAPTQP